MLRILAPLSLVLAACSRGVESGSDMPTEPAAVPGDRCHLAGISNGGRSAFAVAQLDPTRFTSMVVFPGYPESPSDTSGLENLTRLPISMFVGGDDPGWIEPMTVTRDTLHSMGGPVSLTVREGEGHIMTSLANGADVFDFLDSTR